MWLIMFPFFLLLPGSLESSFLLAFTAWPTMLSLCSWTPMITQILLSLVFTFRPGCSLLRWCQFPEWGWGFIAGIHSSSRILEERFKSLYSSVPETFLHCNLCKLCMTLGMVRCPLRCGCILLATLSRLHSHVSHSSMPGDHLGHRSPSPFPSLFLLHPVFTPLSLSTLISEALFPD